MSYKRRYNNKGHNKQGQDKNGFGSMPNTPENTTIIDKAPTDSGSYGLKNDRVEMDFQRKAYRDMAFDTVNVKAGPGEEASSMSNPYAIINSANAVIDAKYAGQDNWSGNIVMQLPTSLNSSFWAIPDSLETKVKVNYNYCKMSDADNADSRVNQKMAIAWREILQSTAASAYYDLAFFQWDVRATDSNKGAVFSQDGLLDLLLAYQTVLQACYTLPLRFRSIRSLETHLKDMCYQNGAQVLSSIYAKLRKSSVVNAFNSISNIIMGHFLDNKWLSQVSMILAIPSRKRNDMLDPLMYVTPIYNLNTNLSVYPTATSSEAMFTTGKYTAIIDDVNSILSILAPNNILKLARQSATTPWSAQQLNQFEKSIVDPLERIVGSLQIFTNDFQDLLTAFKRMVQVGLTDWKLGQYVDLDRLDANYQPKFNKLVFDITRSCMTGSSKILYNLNNNMWETLSLWDVYTGLNTYDLKTGGAILTFSTKDVGLVNGSGSIPVTYPAMFKFVSAETVTRRGLTYSIDLVDAELTESQQRVMGRLFPLSTMTNLSLHIPTVNLTSLASSPSAQSWVLYMLTHVYGYANAQVAANTYNLSIDPDILTQVDVLIPDLTNAIETFCRQRSPFRVLAVTRNTVLGIMTGHTEKRNTGR